MPGKAHTAAFLCSTILITLSQYDARAAAVISQTASIPLTSTDWGPSTGSLAGVDPLVFQQFDPRGGSRILDAVDVSFHVRMKEDFSMRFTTPAIITVSGETGNPIVPGPVVTLYHPDGTTPILVAQAPETPAFLTKTLSYGSNSGETMPQDFGSNLPASSPNYLPPLVSDQTLSSILSSSAELAPFIGPGTVALPVSGTAFSKFLSSSGNGFGKVTTSSAADVTITYEYHERERQLHQFVPEPGNLMLWGLGGVGSLLIHIHGRRRRGA